MKTPFMSFSKSNNLFGDEALKKIKPDEHNSTPAQPTTSIVFSPPQHDCINPSSPLPFAEILMNSGQVTHTEPSYRKSKASDASIFNEKVKKRKVSPEAESGSVSPNSPEIYEYNAENVIAPFIKKFYNILNDPINENIVYWCDGGRNFEIANQFEFCRNVLPKYYKHKNMASFVRQLNLYGFTKIQNLMQGVLNSSTESEKFKFTHPKFQRNKPELLGQVRRKHAENAKGSGRSEQGFSDMSHIYEELDSVKKTQNSINEQLKEIQVSNKKLAETNQKVLAQFHAQQGTIDKLFQFLGAFYRNNQLEKIPRRRPLLLGGTGEGEDYPLSVSEQNAALTQLLYGPNNSGFPNEFLFTNPVSQGVPQLNLQAGADSGALVPSSPRARHELERLNTLYQNNNTNINNLGKAASAVDNSIFGIEGSLGEKAKAELSNSVASSTANCLPFPSDQGLSFDYPSFLDPYNLFDLSANSVNPIGTSAAPLDFKHTAESLGLTSQADDSLFKSYSLPEQFTYPEEVSEIITEPPPVPSSSTGLVTSPGLFDTDNLN